MSGTVNQTLIRALEPLGLPVVPDVDTEGRDRVIVFHYDLRPIQWADDRPQWLLALIQVHLHLPLGENGLALQAALARALAGAGTTWPEVVDLTDEQGQHKVFECECVVGEGM